MGGGQVAGLRSWTDMELVDVTWHFSLNQERMLVESKEDANLIRCRFALSFSTGRHSNLIKAVADTASDGMT